MNPEPLLHHHVPPNEGITRLILDYSEDMLILAYTLTHSPARANRIVAGIFIDIYLRDDDLTPPPASPHTWLYDLVKQACLAHAI